MAGLSGFIELLRAVDTLLALEKEHGGAIDTLQSEMRDVDRRLTRLEAREDIVVEQAKAAAASSASAVIRHSIADMARRVGSLEARTPPLALREPD